MKSLLFFLLGFVFVNDTVIETQDFASRQDFASQLHSLSPQKLVARQYIPTIHADQFAALQVQDFQGRTKPIHTMALELLRKTHGKSSFSYQDDVGDIQKLNATQVFLGMQLKPDSWQLLPIIKIEKQAIAIVSKVLKVSKKGYAKPAHFFNFRGQYVLKDYVAAANAKAPGKRTIFDKDILKIDERINIVWGIFNGQFLRIFPSSDPAQEQWHTPIDEQPALDEKEQLLFSKIIPSYFQQLQTSIQHQDWGLPNETIAILNTIQQQKGGGVLLSEAQVKWEIRYNQYAIFFSCLLGYTLIGSILLILSFSTIFYTQLWIQLGVKISIVLLALCFVYHGFGIGLRWYVSGHAPWSNGYEATVFIAWVGVLAGLLFSKRSPFSVVATVLIAICLLGIAHGNLMSPEVTNLVPVLKSYWLMIHVAVITGSYGFLAMGSVLAVLTLILMVCISKTNAEKIGRHIHEMTRINQLATTIGLYMLTIGTFLGGIWANESWGRYWGWDPKETWALISIIIYATVLHLRIILPKNSLFIYNVCSLFALASLIMTFFGVNYYLSGLHSYAKGDSFPVPQWIFVVIPVLLGISIMAKIRAKRLTI